MNRLSYSSVQKYLNCPFQWKMHYINRLRSRYVGSALPFGCAIDEAFGHLLLGLENEQEKTAEEVFLDHMKTFRYNGEDLDLATSTYLDYSNSDFQEKLLTEEDINSLNVDYEINSSIKDLFNELKQLKKQYKLDLDGLSLYNKMCWLSLKRKGIMLVQAYRDEVLPKIERCYGVQVPVKLPNEEGDEYIGFIDFIASFKDEPGVKYIVDNKTASKAYKEDSVRISEQLASYCEAEGIEKAAYIVAEKNIRKRDPRVRINIIRDEMPEETIDTVFQEIDETLHGIRNEEFEKNFNNCIQYGRRCPYYKICHEEDEPMKGLVNLNNKEK
tara:strand:- start:133 stop:1116 length:984 start_codon:yes stop_codon:yes gene_type:complete